MEGKTEPGLITEPGGQNQKISTSQLSFPHASFPPPPLPPLQCKLAWDGNEAEYEDFYDYSALEGEEGEEGAGATAPSSSSRAMIVDGDAALPPPTALADYELALPSGAVLGSRHLARYYRQAVRPRGDGRRSEAVRRALVERCEKERQREGERERERCSTFP